MTLTDADIVDDIIPNCRDHPVWDNKIGLVKVIDLGNGGGLKLYWGSAQPADFNNQVHYNIYYARTRFATFEDGPSFITTSTEVALNVFEPGKLYYLAVRATDFDPTEFNFTQLSRVGADEVYRYPATQELQSDINDAYGTIVEIADDTGYPDAGFLLVGTEIMKYTSKSGTRFFIEDTNRGIIGTVIENHDAGEEVRLWYGISDGNTVIHTATPAWHYTNGTPQKEDYIGHPNVDEDGYRAVLTDNLTTDLSSHEDAAQHFSTYNYCGYHNTTPYDMFSGGCVNSYSGGEMNGSRGLFLADRNLARLDQMLQMSGERVIVLRRSWSGKRCSCIGLRRENPRYLCGSCFGTGFSPGYTRYINTRAISPGFENTQGWIMIRVEPYANDLELTIDQGLRQPDVLNAWTLSVPVLKDRDIIIRYVSNGEGGLFEEYRYEILDVTRNKLMLEEVGSQRFRMRKLDKTDIVYRYYVEEL